MTDSSEYENKRQEALQRLDGDEMTSFFLLELKEGENSTMESNYVYGYDTDDPDLETTLDEMNIASFLLAYAEETDSTAYQVAQVGLLRAFDILRARSESGEIQMDLPETDM